MEDRRTLMDYNAITYMAKRYVEFTPELASKILNWAENEDVYYTQEGRRFLRRLSMIEMGKVEDSRCVICGNQTTNGVVCGKCISKYADLTFDEEDDYEEDCEDDYEEDYEYAEPNYNVSRKSKGESYSRSEKKRGLIPVFVGLAIGGIVIILLAVIAIKGGDKTGKSGSETAKKSEESMTQEERDYARGLDLYEKGVWGSALQEFEKNPNYEDSMTYIRELSAIVDSYDGHYEKKVNANTLYFIDIKHGMVSKNFATDYSDGFVSYLYSLASSSGGGNKAVDSIAFATSDGIDYEYKLNGSSNIELTGFYDTDTFEGKYKRTGDPLDSLETIHIKGSKERLDGIEALKDYIMSDY